MKLSLIISTYNRSASLLRTLRSVAEQQANRSLWECVVVNNNSCDNTLDIFEHFAVDQPNFRIITEWNQGLSHARNRGIAESFGEYIAFIDDDEIICPDFVDAYISLFDNYPKVSSAGGKIIPQYPSGKPQWLSHYTEIPIANPIDLGNNLKPFPKGHIPGGGNMAVRRTVLDRYGVFNITLGRKGSRLFCGEENDLFHRLSLGGEKCFYLPQAVVYHIIPPEKLTFEYFNQLCYDIGLSQFTRAVLDNSLFVVHLRELGKWIATLILIFTLRPQRSYRLIRMRCQISKAIFSKITTL